MLSARPMSWAFYKQYKIRACQPAGGYVSISLPRCLASPWDTHMKHSLASSRSLLIYHFLREEKASPEDPFPPLLYSFPLLLCQRWSELSKQSCSRAHPSCPGCWMRARAFDPIEHTVQVYHLPENLLMLSTSAHLLLLIKELVSILGYDLLLEGILGMAAGTSRPQEIGDEQMTFLFFFLIVV